jgi:hypothetical protein
MMGVWRRRGLAFGIGASVGLLVGGVGGRLAMRLIADADPSAFGLGTASGATIGTVTVGGTLSVVVQTGILGGGLFGLTYLWIRRCLPRWRALAYGLALTIVATGINVGGNLHDFEILPRLLSVSLFATLFFAYGVITALLIDRAVPRADERAPSVMRLALIGLVAAGAILDVATLTRIASFS